VIGSITIAPQVVTPTASHPAQRPETSSTKIVSPDASDRSQHPQDDDKEDNPQGFKGVLSRALHHAEAPQQPTLRFRFTLPPSSDTKAAPQGPLDNAANNPATAPTPITDKSSILPLTFSIPSALSEQPPASEISSAGTQERPDTPEKLQLDQPQAFTARIKPADAQQSSIAAIQNAADSGWNESKNGEPELADVPKFVVETVATVAAAPQVHAPAAAPLKVMDSRPVVETAAVPPSHPQPLHDISFQLPGARGVEVRLSDQGGEIRVDVRSADPVLTQDLRGNLHELVSGLEHKGFSAQVSHPGETGSGNNAGANSSKDQYPSGQNNGSGRQQQERGDEENPSDPRPPRSPAAAWTEEMNSQFEMRPQ
jgi:hypothetical protein